MYFRSKQRIGKIGGLSRVRRQKHGFQTDRREKKKSHLRGSETRVERHFKPRGGRGTISGQGKRNSEKEKAICLSSSAEWREGIQALKFVPGEFGQTIKGGSVRSPSLRHREKIGLPPMRKRKKETSLRTNEK